jgi:hypothetical protein
MQAVLGRRTGRQGIYGLMDLSPKFLHEVLAITARLCRPFALQRTWRGKKILLWTCKMTACAGG